VQWIKWDQFVATGTQYTPQRPLPMLMLQKMPGKTQREDGLALESEYYTSQNQPIGIWPNAFRQVLWIWWKNLSKGMFESDDNSLMKKYMHLCSSTSLSPFLLSPPSRMLVHIHYWCADSVHKEENFNQRFNCALKLEHILPLANLEGKDVPQCSYFLAFGQLAFFSMKPIWVFCFQKYLTLDNDYLI
jgi:hypothetical protein